MITPPVAGDMGVEVTLTLNCNQTLRCKTDRKKKNVKMFFFFSYFNYSGVAPRTQDLKIYTLIHVKVGSSGMMLHVANWASHFLLQVTCQAVLQCAGKGREGVHGNHDCGSCCPCWLRVSSTH